MFFDEDGDLAHEFYTEQRVEVKAGVVRWVMRKVSSAHLTPQVNLFLSHFAVLYHARGYPRFFYWQKSPLRFLLMQPFVSYFSLGCLLYIFYVIGRYTSTMFLRF